MCHDRTFKQMAKEICHDNLSSVATQRIEYRRAMSQQKTTCRDKTQCVATEHEKNVTSQLRQREIMLRQGFLC